MKGKHFMNYLLVLALMAAMFNIVPQEMTYAMDEPEYEYIRGTQVREGDYLYATMPDGAAIILWYYGSDEEVVIPEKLGGMTVCYLGDSAFKDCYNLKKVTMPSTIKTMGADVFYGCKRLREIVLSADLRVIWGYDFNYCFDLERIIIPDNVTTIGSDTFHFCESLTHITIGQNVSYIGKDVFMGCNAVQTVYFKGDAPEVSRGAYFGNNCVIYYPDNGTWTEEKKAEFRGEHTWVPYDPETVSVNRKLSGSISSYDSLYEDVYMEVVHKQGSSWTEYVYEGNYCMENLLSGDYEVTFSKIGHANRTYEITICKEDATLDAELNYIGDVTGDGKVNTRDLNRLYAHVNGTSELTGYALDCGEVTEDGKINTRDLNRLYAHVRRSNLLW